MRRRRGQRETKGTEPNSYNMINTEEMCLFCDRRENAPHSRSRRSRRTSTPPALAAPAGGAATATHHRRACTARRRGARRTMVRVRTTGSEREGQHLKVQEDQRRRSFLQANCGRVHPPPTPLSGDPFVCLLLAAPSTPHATRSSWRVGVTVVTNL